MPTKKPAKTTVAPTRRAQVKKPAPQPGTVRVAAIQMASGPNVPANLAEADDHRTGVEGGARLVVLPAFSASWQNDADVVKRARRKDTDRIQSFLSRMAKKHQSGWSAVRPLGCQHGEHGGNSCLVYDERGKLVARYEKITCSARSRNGITRKPSDRAGRQGGVLNSRSAASACRSATTCASRS